MVSLSRKMDIFREYEEALALAIENSQSSLWIATSLYYRQIISQEDLHSFLSLDHNPDHLDEASKSRYLLHVALLKIEERGQDLILPLIRVLEKYHEMKIICYYLLKDIQKCEAGRDGVVTYSDDDIVVSEIHVNMLAEILHDARHKWEQIGVALNLSEADREECRDFNSNNLNLYRILLKWYKKNDKAQLGTLKKALQSSIVGECKVSESLFDKLREKVIAIVSPQKRLRTGNSYTENPNELSVSDGKSMLLEVTLSEFNKSGVCHWCKDGQLLHEDSKYYGVHTKFLLIKHACQGIEGTYTCKIGNMEMIKKTLKVIFSPVKQNVIEIYSKFPNISKNSWPPVGSSDFIKLALINEKRPFDKTHDDSVRGDMDDILKEKKIELYEVLFQKYEEGALILIEGRPGSGKTTLTRKLSKDWATKPDILTGANLVFLISLRMLNSVNKALLTLSYILEPLYSSPDQLSELVYTIHNNSGSGCCFVIDGLDEYQDRNDSDNLIHKLVHKYFLPKAMIIVASRPIGSVNLRRHVNISKRIEVLGFSKEFIHSYIKSYFLNDEQKADELSQYLTSHINLLHMCYLPVHAAMICYIYQQPSEVIPVTETKMYEYFTLLTIKRKLEHDGNPIEYKTLSKLDGNILKSFQNVCELAFNMTIQSKQTITLGGNDATLSENYSDVHSLGLVTIDKTAELFGMKDLYSFLHLTFQEFLAAYHIHMCPIEEQMKIIRKYIENKEMLNVWKFYCGSSTLEFHSKCLAKLMKSKQFSDIYKIQCVFESQQEEACDFVFENSEIKSLEFNDHTFLPTDLNALIYTFNKTSTPITKLLFNSCILDEAGVNMLINSTISGKLKCIKSLNFSMKTKNKEQFEVIQLFLSNCIWLEELGLENTEIYYEEVEILTDTVKLPNLRYLGIHVPLRKGPIFKSYSDKDLLSKISTTFPHLEEVRYTYNELTYKTHKECLIDLLQSFKCTIRPACEIPIGFLSNTEIELERLPEFFKISNLVLVNCNLFDTHLECLINLVAEKLEILKLDCNLITFREVTVLPQFLKKCTNLTHISLSCNMIDEGGAMTIAYSIMSSKLLQLNLQGNCFGDQGALALAQAADKMCDDFRLILGNCHISNEMCEKIPKITEKVESEQRLIRLSKFLDLSDSGSVQRAMPCFKNLQTLNLSGKRISKTASSVFTKVLLSHCSFLQTLDLSYCNLTNIDTLLLDGDHVLSNLSCLNLGGNQLDDESFDDLKELKGFTKLKELNFSQNELREEGVECLAYCFKHINIEVLNLSSNKIGAAGAAALARWLRIGKGYSKFEKDDISSNYKHDASYNDFLLAWLNNHVRRTGLDGNIIPHGDHKWHGSLIELDLSYNDIGINGAAALGYGLKCCHKLQSLNLDNNGIIFGMEVLLEELKHCPILSLNLDNNHFSLFTEQLWKLPRSIQNLSLNNVNLNCEKMPKKPQVLLLGLLHYSNLKVLNLQNTQIGFEEVQAFGEGLKSVRELEELRIGGNNLSCDQIIEGIENSHHLKTLHLQMNIVNSQCLYRLANHMKHSQIIDLNLSQTDLHKAQGTSWLSEGLKYCSKMQHLDLSSNELDTNDIKILSIGIKICKYMEILDLSNNNFDSDGAVHLAEGINCFCNLISINVSHNKISSDGAVVLMDALKHCIEMEQLQIQFNCIGPDGAAAVADWISCTYTKWPRLKSCLLTVLSLDGNQIQTDGAIKIAEALQFCEQLQLLSMSNNEIGPEAANPLAIGLQYCTELYYLYLDHNNFGGEGVTLLADGLKRNHSLKILSLQNNKVTMEGAAAMAERLQHVLIKRLDLRHNDVYSNHGLAKALPHCDIYTDQGLTNQAIRKAEKCMEKLLDYISDSD